MAPDHHLTASQVRPVGAEDVRPLRHSILRPGRPWEETAFPGDADPETVHLAAFDGDRLVGIASLYREPRPAKADGWRLRGMGTAEDARGRGAGRALLAACVAHVAAHGGGELWCNARAPAASFYRAAGFSVLSGEFEIPGIGPHVVMSLDVPAARPAS
ncbi:MAG TPA: GNAT family N-acetyltransferase [Acidimicrobiales bacterium]|nr:GNAT family N-acetyltransferase [Acidimicrobiales bacterium]